MPDYATIAVGATRAALSIMRSLPPAPERIDRLVDTLHELAHSVNDQLQREGDPQRRHLPVCSAGCATCCHTDVLVSPPELLRIARYLRTSRSEVERAALRTRLSELAARTRDTTSDDWKRQKLACPLLDEASGSCTIYEVRPGTCRAYNSVSLPKCLEQYEAGNPAVEIPCNAVQQKAILSVGIGLAAACRLKGLEWEGVSLTAGLHAILDQEDAAERWLGGEKPFQGAHTKMSRTSAPFLAKDVEATVRGMQAHPEELPEAASRLRSADDDAARRERNKKKRLRKGR